MEAILNTISKGNSTQVNSTNYDLVISVDYQKDEEMIDEQLISLNEVSIDEIEILDKPTFKNGVRGIECELLINQNNNAIVELDLNGSLSITDVGVEKYSINDMGELIIQL